MTREELDQMLGQIATALQERGRDTYSVDQLRSNDNLFEVVGRWPPDQSPPLQPIDVDATAQALRQLHHEIEAAGLDAGKSQAIQGLIDMADAHLRHATQAAEHQPSHGPHGSPPAGDDAAVVGPWPINKGEDEGGADFGIEGKWPPD
jgi:hypothetical protein